MQAGGHSLGKSTLIANLLASYTPTPSPSAASSDDGAAQFHASQCAVVEVADEAERVVYCLTLQETSPLGSVGALAEVERALGKGNLAGMDGGGEVRCVIGRRCKVMVVMMAMILMIIL